MILVFPASRLFKPFIPAFKFLSILCSRTPFSSLREREGGRAGERGRERGRPREGEGGRGRAGERERGRESERERGGRESGREREGG